MEFLEGLPRFKQVKGRMIEPPALSASTRQLFRCPRCFAPLTAPAGDAFECGSLACAARFPVVNGIPILIDEAKSIFSLSDFMAQKDTTFTYRSQAPLKKFLTRWLPNINLNVKAAANYKRLLKELVTPGVKCKVLIVGGGIMGKGMEEIYACPDLEIVGSDVSFGPCTQVICDGHDLPFCDGAFDAVIVQAVLEHVLDPYRCVDEIHRVLKPCGVVYAETPFMQAVHMGRFDFTRFSHLGHRRLFRKFDSISDGPVCGPGMALSWSYQYFLLSFVRGSLLVSAVKFFTRITTFWWKYFDYWLIDKPGSFDAASGYYFLGRKSAAVLHDRELIRLYKGLQ